MRKSRMLRIFTAMAILLSLCMPTMSHGASFYDTRGHWAESYIDQSVNAGIVQGYPDGAFRPDNAVTRAEFISMINKLLKNTGSTSIYFSDVPYGSWYYNDIAKGVAASYVSGYASNDFSPNNPISRQEAAVIISRIVPDANNNTSLNSFTDSWSIPDWAYPAFQKANSKGYLGAYSDGKLHPSDQLTRGQAAKILSDISSKEHIVASNTSLRNSTSLSNTIYSNGFTMASDLGSGTVTVDNCVVLGTLTVNGAKSNLNINSGAVNNLTVLSSAKDAAIAVKGTASIGTADVYAASAFTGSGSISKMNIYADNVTYERKPTSVYIGVKSSDTTSTDTDVTFSPKNGTKNVSVTSKITITFSSAMTLYDGGIVYGNDILDFVTLRAGSSSSSGNNIGFSSSINSAKKVITITPDEDFEKNKTYHLSVERHKLKFSDGSGNKAYSISFSTGNTVSGSDDITFDPGDDETGVSKTVEPTIEFEAPVITYDDAMVTKDYLKDTVIIFREDSSSGKKVPFTATINSSKDTITIAPKNDLTDGQDYYLGIASKKFKYKASGDTVDSAYVIWTVGKKVVTTTTTAVTLSNLSATPAVTTASVSARPSAAGTLYAVLLKSTDSAITAAQIKDGKNSTGTAVPSTMSGFSSVTSGSAKAFTFTGLDANTSYTCYLVLNSSGKDSQVYTVAVKTTDTTTPVTPPVIPPAATPSAVLVNIQVTGGTLSPNFASDTKEYKVDIPFDESASVTIAAIKSPGSAVFIGSVTESVSGTVVDVGRNTPTKSISYKVKEEGKTDSTYKVTVNLKGKTSAGIESTDFLDYSSTTYYVATDATQAAITIKSDDDKAEITCTALSAAKSTGTMTGTLNLSGDVTKLTFTVKSNSDTKTHVYYIEKI